MLYKQAKPEQVKTLAQIKSTVRKQTLQITPQLGFDSPFDWYICFNKIDLLAFAFASNS